MDDQQSYALQQMALWARNLGIVEIKRALAICAEQASKASDGTDLAHRLMDRACGVTEDSLVNALEGEQDPPPAGEAGEPQGQGEGLEGDGLQPAGEAAPAAPAPKRSKRPAAAAAE